MIKIRREDCPPSLNKHDCDFHENDYAKDDVIEALLRMQHRKCCYCEAKLKKMGPKIKEVDHYIPRSAEEYKGEDGNKQLHLVNKWTNLLYSCRSCNGEKLQQHPYNKLTGELELVDPSDDGTDPEEHIGFILDSEYKAHDIKGKTELGETTCRILKFGERIDLISKFNKIALEIDKCFTELKDAIMFEENADTEAKKRELSRLMSADCEFTGFCRAYIRMKLDKFNEKGIPFITDTIGKTLEVIDIYFPREAETVDA